MTNPTTPRELTAAERRDGLLVGAVIGARLAARTAACQTTDAVQEALGDGPVLPLAPPPGRRPATTALADALLEEFALGGVDLRRLTGRWVSWWRDDGYEAGPLLEAALGQIAEFDAPAATLQAASAMPMVAALPAAIASATPGTMVSGAYHVAKLLDPSDEAALAAVAIVLAASRLLDGQRDFIPDVLALLRANQASPGFLDALVAVPRDPRRAPPRPAGEEPDPRATLAWVLWQVQNGAKGVEPLTAMVQGGGGSPILGALLGALVGARDGIAGWPSDWLEAAGEDALLRRALAHRLGA
jgi:hypothetical protein